MGSLDASACPGCGLVAPGHDGPTHPHIASSPACWAGYGEVLAREYGDPSDGRVHQLTVDTYAAQHPGVREPRSIRSIALHLMTLCLVLERGADPASGPSLHKRLARATSFGWLEPPRPLGTLTVADVARATTIDAHVQTVRAWARDVWEAWRPHHATVRGWVEQELGGRPDKA